MACLRSEVVNGFKSGQIVAFVAATQTKISELILSNKDNQHTVELRVSIHKTRKDSPTVILPSVRLLPLESNLIKMSTFLDASDRVIVEIINSEVVENDVDIMISCAEV